jgi:hypothetical protein
MDLRTFAVERLGIGDWPNVEEEDEFRIDPKAGRRSRTRRRSRHR